MNTRIRMGMKPSAKGIVNVDVTVDCGLEGEETSKDVAIALKEAVTEFKATVEELGYTNVEVAPKKLED